MRHQTARVKALKDSAWVLQNPSTLQYIAFADERRAPHLAPLHLATLSADTPEDLAAFKQLASRRLAGVPCELERIDSL